MAGSAPLFSAAGSLREPLASRMRPRNLDEYIGQDHIVGKGRLLRRAIAADQLTSVIFYGPPGSGKTTLARVIANHTRSNFITLNAVLTGVADIRTAIAQAEEHYTLYSRRTILFVDEVHRWNKSQQDALLPWVENGTIILIGATTENPFFEVNKALVSRSRVFQLKGLSASDLHTAALQALSDAERGYGRWRVTFEAGALEHLIETANGDARSLLNALELAVETTPEKWSPAAEPPVPAYGSTIYISKETAEESIQKKAVLYDRDGDYHYDIISAFIKSIRGRDADAAMYWLARMVAAGEDPHFIFRRMLISSCEDTGLADPLAVGIVNSAAEAFDRVGMPEGRYFLAHAALYLATAPKSNSSMAFFDALASVEKEDAEVPNHLRDSNRDAEGFGHGAGYLYPHAYRDHWVVQQYLPKNLMGRVFYTPSSQGYEKQIREEVLSRRELQIAAMLENAQAENSEREGNAPSHTAKEESSAGGGGEQPLGEWWISEHFNTAPERTEQLTFSPKDSAKERALDKAELHWRRRLDSNKAETLLAIRDAMIGLAALQRHYRSLVWNADDGLLLWEIARKTPEGFTCGVCRTQSGREILEKYARTLTDLDRPLLEFRSETDAPFLSADAFRKLLYAFQDNGAVFDRLFFRDPFANTASACALADALKNAASVKKQAGKIFIDSGETDDSAEDEAMCTELPFAEGWAVIIAQKIPSGGQRIAPLIKNQILTPATAKPYLSLLEKMDAAEAAFFENEQNELFNWNADTITEIFRNAGFAAECRTQTLTEKRRITAAEIKKWFDAVHSAYGASMAAALSPEELQKLLLLLDSAAEKQIFNWQSETAFLCLHEQKKEAGV